MDCSSEDANNALKKLYAKKGVDITPVLNDALVKLHSKVYHSMRMRNKACLYCAGCALGYTGQLNFPAIRITYKGHIVTVETKYVHIQNDIDRRDEDMRKILTRLCNRVQRATRRCSKESFRCKSYPDLAIVKFPRVIMYTPS